MRKNQYLRLWNVVEPADPEGGDEGDDNKPDDTNTSDSTGDDTSNEPDVDDEANEADETDPDKTFKQSELNAIIERRIGKTRAELEETKKLAAEAQKALADYKAQEKESVEQAIQKGKTEARRENLSKAYGIDIDLLPEDEEKLTRFEKQQNATIANKRKVLPVEVVDKGSTLPSFVTGVRS